MYYLNIALPCAVTEVVLCKWGDSRNKRNNTTNLGITARTLSISSSKSIESILSASSSTCGSDKLRVCGMHSNDKDVSR